MRVLGWLERVIYEGIGMVRKGYMCEVAGMVRKGD